MKYEIMIKDQSELKLKKFREIMRVVYKMLEIEILIESKIQQNENK